MTTELTESFIKILENFTTEDLNKIDVELFAQISEYNRTQTNADRAWYLRKIRSIIGSIIEANEG